ncbi:hypothetical protein ACFE04_011360 [Oxalis oulophora]
MAECMLIALFFKPYAVKADIRLFIGVLSASSRPKGIALFEMNSQGLDPRTSLPHGAAIRLCPKVTSLFWTPYFSIQLLIEPGVESPSLHIHSSYGCWSSDPSPKCSLPAENHNGTVACGTSNLFAAVRLANRTQHARRPPVRRRLVLETAAAARVVNDQTCCNLRITRQLFRSIRIRLSILVQLSCLSYGSNIEKECEI